MALADALLSTFRTQQIANQQRQANQLQRERLDVSRQQLGLQQQQEGRLAEQFEIEQRGRSNDGLFNSYMVSMLCNLECNVNLVICIANPLFIWPCSSHMMTMQCFTCIYIDINIKYVSIVLCWMFMSL